MRKRIALLIAAVVMALSMSVSGVAFAAISEGSGNGNPDSTASGKCPAGQNKDTSPGGLKKCSRLLRGTQRRFGARAPVLFLALIHPSAWKGDSPAS
jgi:hypothetical protein